MNTKLRIMLLAMLGLSTAACCNTKKTSQGADDNPQPVDIDAKRPELIAMYAAPMPYPMPPEIDEPQPNRPQGLVSPEGSTVLVLNADAARRVMEFISTENPIASSSIYELEDGRIAIALPTNRASEVEAIMSQLGIEGAVADGVAFPDGSTVQVLTDERAAEILERIEAERSADAE